MHIAVAVGKAVGNVLIAILCQNSDDSAPAFLFTRPDADIHGGPACDFSAWITHHTRKALVDIDIGAIVDACDGHRLWAGIESLGETFLGGAQRLLRLFARADIDGKD